MYGHRKNKFPETNNYKNCGSEKNENFCPECGQKPTLKDLL